VNVDGEVDPLLVDESTNRFDVIATGKQIVDATKPSTGLDDSEVAAESKSAPVEAIDQHRVGGHSRPVFDEVARDPDDADTTVDSAAVSEPSPIPELADPDRLSAAVEAILFVVESPVSAAQIATVVQRPVAEVEASIERLTQTYVGDARGIELRRIADGVRIYTRPELTGVVEAFLLDGQRSRLSPAALETLAVIAYRQPVTRGRISAIRGVNVDGVVRTLTSRGLIIEDGTEPDSGAGLFRTTALFLEKMGLQSVEELPSLAPLLPDIDSFETDELSS
jgi:segregation and condensation protein B